MVRPAGPDPASSKSAWRCGEAAASTPSSRATPLPGRGEWAHFLVNRSGFHVKGLHVCVLSWVSPASLYQGPPPTTTPLSPGGPAPTVSPTGLTLPGTQRLAHRRTHGNLLHRRGNRVQGLRDLLRGCTTASVTVTVMVTEKASCSLPRPRDKFWDGEDGVSNHTADIYWVSSL